MAAGFVNTGEIEKLGGTVAKAREAAAGGPVFEVQLTLAEAESASHRVDRDPDLHPVTGGERDDRAEGG